MPQEIYVWQRVWNEQVGVALRTARDAAAGFAVLTAEIDVRRPQPKIIRPNIDFTALKFSARPIAVAIRIDPFAGPFREHDRVVEAIVKLAREEVAKARSHEIDISELQIDFDCAESKLDGYRIWLKEIRASVQPLRVIPTALPSWLGHREFSTLAKDSGSFILQVHSVSVPQKVDDTRKLTDPREAAAWVEQAARVGVPFRVSLPTYSYMVAFDAEGKFCGMSAEGLSARWPREAVRVRWESQPEEMAALIARWTRSRPAMLRGVFWYRLPVASDALNWNWKTLAAAMQGRAPKSDLRVSASASQPSEIVVKNDGEKDEPLPEWIEARWTGSKLIAADALQGYELRTSSDASSVHFELTAAGRTLRLPPDGHRNVAWVRCEPPTAIQVSVPARPLSADRLSPGGGNGH